jgi:hypothetical protein
MFSLFKIRRSYLVGNCPHDLFTNTKNELGALPATRSSNEALKTEYLRATAHIPHIRRGATQPKTAIAASYRKYAVSTTPLCSPNPAIFCISTGAAGSLRSPGAAARKADAEQKHGAPPWALFTTGMRKCLQFCLRLDAGEHACLLGSKGLPLLPCRQLPTALTISSRIQRTKWSVLSL